MGGLLPILEPNPEQKIRLKELGQKITAHPLTEVILALSVNPEGDNTVEYLKRFLAEPAAKQGFKISVLGRGLSTGTELEYSDADTLKNALKNRG